MDWALHSHKQDVSVGLYPQYQISMKELMQDV